MLAGISWRVLVCAAALTLASFVLVQLSFVVVPLLLAILFSSILTPLALRLQARGMSPGAAATASIGLVLLVLIAIGALTIPPLISNGDTFVASLSGSLDRLSEILADSPFDVPQSEATQLAEKIKSYGPELRDMLVSGLGTLIPMVGRFAAIFFLAIVMTGYMLHDGDRYWRWALGFVEEPRRPAMSKLGTEAYSTLAAYIRGTALVAVFNSTAITFGAFLLGLPLLLPIAIIIFIAAFLPIVGAWIAATVTICIALASGGLDTAIGMGIIYLLVSQFKSYFISPFVVGGRVNLAPIVTLTTVMVGTVLGGIMGGILAVPLMATISGALGQIRRWRVDGTYGADLIPVLEEPA